MPPVAWSAIPVNRHQESNPVTLITAFAITRIDRVRLARLAAWSFAFVVVAGIERLFYAEPAGFRMLAIILTLFYATKSMVTVAARVAGEQKLTPICWIAFAAFWFGMRPSIFATLGNAPVQQARYFIKMGIFLME
jgi:hypothetical protein